MAGKSRTPFVLPLEQLSSSSLRIPATRPSPLATGKMRSLGTVSIESSPASSSPPFSFTKTAASSSPEADLFEEFTYSDDMDGDFRRIDTNTTAILGAGSAQENDLAVVNNNRADADPTPPPQKTWVVFHGKAPGVYDDWQPAILQVQCFPDAFQRAFPNHEVAEAAWVAFMRDGTFPDYGRSPWVVYFGRRLGVFTRVTEVEASVRGYTGALYQSCSSVTEGKIRLQLFSRRVARMFYRRDPFANVADLMSSSDVSSSDESDDNEHEIGLAAHSVTPVLATLDLPLAPEPANSSGTASNDVAEALKSAFDTVAEYSEATPGAKSAESPCPGEGWYVVFHGGLPGVFFGVEALKSAKPKPGGFQCAIDKESADLLFLELSLGGKVVWTKSE